MLYVYHIFDEDGTLIERVPLSTEEMQDEFRIDYPFSEEDLKEIGYELCEGYTDAVDFKLVIDNSPSF